MIRNKALPLWCQSPTAKTKKLNRGFGVDLTHAKGIYKLAIEAATNSGPVTGEPNQLRFMGEKNADGLYEFPIHCHGVNILSGEAFAAAVLAAAESNAKVTASLDGNILTYSSTATVQLLPAGRLRGALGEIFTVMFRLCAPENTGSSLSSGVSLTYTYGSQIVSYSGTYAGETVQMIANSNSSRQLIGLSLTTTSGLPRKMDISSFGIFRGTVAAESFSPYWGDRVSFFLTEPLLVYSTLSDFAYPLQGYAERWVRSALFKPESAVKTELSSSYPIYRLSLPESFYNTSPQMDRFSSVPNESTLAAGALRYMRSPEGDSILVSANTSDNTPEKFLQYFNSFDVHLLCARSEPLIERFAPITLPTRKGRNYVELQTEVAPFSLQFTYL